MTGNGSDITLGQDSYTYGTTFPNPLLNPQEPSSREAWTNDEDLVESRRTTITQQIQCVIILIHKEDANEDMNHLAPLFCT
jgi:hypothetical protein